MTTLFESSRAIPTLQNCIDLVNACPDCFIRKDEVVNDINISTFSYRLYSYSDFNREFARNLRGITFRTDTGELLGLSFHKFFNLNESPFSEISTVNQWKIKKIKDKVDGSLIYFYYLDGKLCCRTKMSNNNKQSIQAMDIVNNDPKLRRFILFELLADRTPMFEYVAPDNRVVLFYPERKILYLGSRSTLTGDYFDDCPSFIEKAEEYPVSSVDEIIILCSFGGLKNKKGFVICFENGEMVKIKTEEYLALHKLKDSLTSEKNIAIAYFNNVIDDALAVVTNDAEKKFVLDTIEKVKSVYADWYKKSLTFFEENKHRERKDYAIKGQNDLGKVLFGLAMNLYTGKITDLGKAVQEAIIKNEAWAM